MRTVLLLTLGGSVAQTNLVPSFAVGGVTPDLPLIMTVISALRPGPSADVSRASRRVCSRTWAGGASSASRR